MSAPDGHPPDDPRQLSRRGLLAGVAAAGLVLASGGVGRAARTAKAKAKAKAEVPREPTPITRFAFGACLYNSGGGAILDLIARSEPELMLWLGDNIYADTEDMAEMAGKYARLGANPRFKRLARRCPQLAMWDDHDYGKNNAGAEYPRARESKALFLDFWKAGRHDVRRRRGGVYIARTFGPPGREVQFIFLDGRSFRTSRHAGRDGQGTMLGAAQWKWLEASLREPAALRFLCSGIQVVNTEYARWESWGDFPHERERLFRTIRDAQAHGLVILSGDMHHAELSRDAGVLGYDAWDLTSAGLDQHEDDAWANSRRVGEVYNGRGGKFGLVHIAWGDDPTVTLEVRDRANAVVITHTLRRSELTP